MHRYRAGRALCCSSEGRQRTSHYTAAVCGITAIFQRLCCAQEPSDTQALLLDLVQAAMRSMAVAPAQQDSLLQKPPPATPSLKVRVLADCSALNCCSARDDLQRTCLDSSIQCNSLADARALCTKLIQSLPLACVMCAAC